MVVENGVDLLTSIGSSGNFLAAAGIAIGIGLAGIGSAIGLGISGCAASGVTAEDEKNFSNALILEALPQTQVVYAFIIGVLIFIGINGGEMTVEKGLLALAAGVAVGLTGISAIFQGKVAAAAVGASAKNTAIRGKVLIFIVMPEIAALFGFVLAILILIAGQVF
jgi:V/A-type H+-transporting ATPase subunit K